MSWNNSNDSPSKNKEIKYESLSFQEKVRIMQQQVSNGSQNLSTEPNHDPKQPLNTNKKTDNEKTKCVQQQQNQSRVCSNHDKIEQNSNNTSQLKGETVNNQYNKSTFNERLRTMQNITSNQQEIKQFKKTQESNCKPNSINQQQNQLPTKIGENSNNNNNNTSQNNPNNTSNQAQIPQEVKLKTVSRVNQCKDKPEKINQIQENPKESLIQRRVRLFQNQPINEPHPTNSNNKDSSIGEIQNTPTTRPPDISKFDPNASKPIEPKQTKEERLNLIQERLKVYNQNLNCESIGKQQNSKNQTTSKKQENLIKRQEKLLKKTDSSKKIKNFSKHFEKNNQNQETETNIEIESNDQKNKPVIEGERFDNKVEMIKIDILTNKHVCKRMEEIKENITNSVTIFEKKYCEVLKNSLRNFIESLIFDEVNDKRNIIPKDMLLKIYITKLESLKNDIEFLLLKIDSFYDDKLKLDEKEEEEEINDENEMKARSMLYVMSEKESFKEIRINVDSDEIMKTEIPQDF